jgi:predicted phage tail protein
MERKTVIKLSGSMAQRFGRTHRRALTSASEVFRALSNTIDGFDAYLRELGRRVGFCHLPGPPQYRTRRV